MRSTDSWEVSTGAEGCEEIWGEEKGVGDWVWQKAVGARTLGVQLRRGQEVGAALTFPPKVLAVSFENNHQVVRFKQFTVGKVLSRPLPHLILLSQAGQYFHNCCCSCCCFQQSFEFWTKCLSWGFQSRDSVGLGKAYDIKIQFGE